jgi:hypothetical protein
VGPTNVVASFSTSFRIGEGPARWSHRPGTFSPFLYCRSTHCSAATSIDKFSVDWFGLQFFEHQETHHASLLRVDIMSHARFRYFGLDIDRLAIDMWHLGISDILAEKVTGRELSDRSTNKSRLKSGRE